MSAASRSTYSDPIAVDVKKEGRERLRNVLLQQVQQPWSSDELAQVATELSQLKRALANQLATSGNDADVDDADVDDAIEIGHVGSAEKAARKGDQAGVVDALKILGRKTWGLVEQLGLAYGSGPWPSCAGMRRLAAYCSASAALATTTA